MKMFYIFIETLAVFENYLSQDISTKGNILLILKSTVYGEWKQLKIWKMSHKVVYVWILSSQNHI